MIELKDLNKYYKSGQGTYHALRDINLKLPDKGLVFIVGKSGSGKSTLLNIIGGIDSYDSGELSIDDVNTKNFTSKDYNTYRNTYIGFIFQEFNVIKSLSVYDNVALSLELHHKSPKEHNDEILGIIEKVGLKNKENRAMNEISGGERQRVAIARALVKNPKVIIADEPTGNLDTKNRDVVMDILKELSKDRLVLIVTHDKEIATKYGDRAITIKDGEVTKDEVYNEQNIVYSEKIYKTEPVSPNLMTSFKLGLKGFLQHKLRFILIILLFSFSLIFAGSTVNLSLTDSSSEYAKYQKDYNNNILNIGNEYTNYGYVFNSGFYNHEVDAMLEKYSTEFNETGLEFYKSMLIEIPFSDNVNSTGTFRSQIERITLFSSQQKANTEMYLTEDEEQNRWRAAGNNTSERNSHSIYITDYIADNLLLFGYFNTDVSTYDDIITKSIKCDQMNNELYIRNIIITGYKDLVYSSDVKKQVAFKDNISYYNSIFVTSTQFNSILNENNLKYAYDDVVYNCLDKVGTYDNVKIMPFDDETHIISTSVDQNGSLQYDESGKPILLGAAPKKPLPQKAVQMAVSRGFLEKVLNTTLDQISFIYSSDNLNYLMVNTYNQVVTFYVCGHERVPTPLSFYVTCVVDSDEVAVYSTALDEHDSYYKYLSTSYTTSNTNAGFPLIKISEDPNVNANIYKEMLAEDIIINNLSFKKLLIVSNFIDENIILFIGLFFVFCLFSILIIFNFVIINIKNSTKDIGIYLSLGMNGWKVSLIYLFQVLLISVISIIIALSGTAIFLGVLDANFSAQALIDFKIIKFTGLGVVAIISLAILTPLLAVIFPLINLSKKKPIDIIKVS